MDGRFNGHPIIQAGGQGFGGGFPGQQFAGGFPGQQFGGVSSYQSTISSGFGGPVGFGGIQQAGFGGQSAAAALDAADGVMDGRFNGRPIVQTGSQFGGFPQGGIIQGGGFGGVVHGASSYVQAPPIVTNQPMGFGGIQQGGFQTTTIQQGGIVGGFPGGFQQGGIIQQGGFPGGFQQGGFQQGFPGGFQQGHHHHHHGGQAAAQRLDAADGRIDGAYFGRPIVRGH
jgi:hypothetical protein